MKISEKLQYRLSAKCGDVFMGRLLPYAKQRLLCISMAKNGNCPTNFG
jgi:hypothetical protein